jgi:energy-coupling factor transporter ATP-binding protein EcfA2
MPDMCIESLHIKNVRLFNEVDIQFNRKFNFLAGPNGCGKTSALACISHCFDKKGINYSRFGEDSELWTDIITDKQKMRTGYGKGLLYSVEFDNYRNLIKIDAAKPENRLPDGNNRLIVNPGQTKQIVKTFPYFAGARRDIKYVPITGVVSENITSKAFNMYLKNMTKSIFGDWQPNVKQWIVNRYFMADKDWAAQEKKNWEHLIGNLPKISPFDSDFSYVETRANFEPVFSLYGKKCYLEELSAGYQAVLSLIVGIFEWIEAIMEGESRLAVNARGTVLIDEPDIHLHPEWQFTLRQGLISLFPNLQFIVTTHSPHFLASAGPGEVIIMPKAYTEEKYTLVPRKKAFSGWNTEQILTEIMGVESLEKTEYAKLYDSATEAYTGKNIKKLKEIIASLEAICHPDDPAVAALKTRLAALIVSRSEGGTKQ